MSRSRFSNRYDGWRTSLLSKASGEKYNGRPTLCRKSGRRSSSSPPPPPSPSPSSFLRLKMP
eukprot:244643-Hanusia_phi.AAC.1